MNAPALVLAAACLLITPSLASAADSGPSIALHVGASSAASLGTGLAFLGMAMSFACDMEEGQLRTRIVPSAWLDPRGGGLGLVASF